MDKSQIIDKLKELLGDVFPNEKIIPDNITEIADFVIKSNIEWKADDETKTLSLNFLIESFRDISSSKILYKKKKFPHTVFHLQQAVEKSTKSYCLGTGILTRKEIKGFRGHDTPYLLLNAIFEKTGLKTLLKTQSAEAKNRLNKAWESIENTEKRLEIAKINLLQIKYHLAEIDSYNIQSEALITKLYQLLMSITGETNTVLPLIIRTMSVLSCLFILGAITFPHESFTRYPDGQMTPNDYSKDLGIVKAIPHINRYLERIVAKLELMLSQEYQRSV